MFILVSRFSHITQIFYCLLFEKYKSDKECIYSGFSCRDKTSFFKFAEEERKQFHKSKFSANQTKLKQKNNLSAYPHNEKRRKNDGNAHFWQRNSISQSTSNNQLAVASL